MMDYSTGDIVEFDNDLMDVVNNKIICMNMPYEIKLTKYQPKSDAWLADMRTADEHDGTVVRVKTSILTRFGKKVK